MKILIEVNITEAELNALQAIDQANQTDAPLHKLTDLEARFGKDMLEKLEAIGMFDWEYDEWVKDVLYTVSSMGYRTLSSAIQSGILKGEVSSPT